MNIFAVLALIGLIVLSSCTAYQTATIPNETQNPGTVIVISDYQFNPQIVTVKAGEKVTWKNLDKDAHSLMYETNTSDLLERGQTFSIIVSVPGRYEYASGNHPFIEGILIVKSE